MGHPKLMQDAGLSLYMNMYIYIAIYINLFTAMFHCQRLSDSKLRTPWASNILWLPNSKPGMHPIFGSAHWLRTRLFQCTESWFAKSEIQKNSWTIKKNRNGWPSRSTLLSFSFIWFPSQSQTTSSKLSQSKLPGQLYQTMVSRSKENHRKTPTLAANVAAWEQHSHPRNHFSRLVDRDP